jgi:hypothetical protein
MRHATVSSRRLWLAVAVLLLATLACGFQGGAFGPVPTPRATNQVMVPLVGGGVPQGSTASEPALMNVTPLAAQAVPASGGMAERILITAPAAGQGLRSSFHVEGLTDPALAQQLYLLVRDAQGKVIAAGRPTVQAGKFIAEVPLPADMPSQTGRVIIYAISLRNSGLTHLSSVEVQLNGEGQSTAPIDSATPEGIAIAFPSPGAEVQSMVKVAASTMLGPKVIVEVRDANDQTVGRVEQAVEQVAGRPAQALVEVPFQVSAAQPGRVLVYTLNPRDGQTEHLSSVEVNLVP